MNSEIEAKFLNLDHDEIRSKLQKLGAVCEQPMRLMRRVVIHSPAMTEKNAFVRVRDEGDRVTITYKQFDQDTVDGAKEYEVAVEDFDTAVNIFTAAGLEYDTYQETKRENWKLGDVEIMLDEWPWLNPYIEIEAATEADVRRVADLLELNWDSAVFGGVANAYKEQYPFIGDAGIDTINKNWPLIKFDIAPPDLITQDK